VRSTSMAWTAKGKVTRREQFLAEMDAVISWTRLRALIEPHYPKAGQGRQPLGLETMLRIYFLQQWFNLSDPQAEDAIYDNDRAFLRYKILPGFGVDNANSWMRSTTASRCGVSRGWSWATMWCRENLLSHRSPSQLVHNVTSFIFLRFPVDELRSYLLDMRPL
jgi:hypothetical protein